MPIHVRAWSGSSSVRITDMTNAGKRGKRCHVWTFSGWEPHGGDETARRAAELSREVRRVAEALPRDSDFELSTRALQNLVINRLDGLPEHCGSSRRDDIRSIDAPRERLECVVGEEFSASLHDSGVTVDDLTDKANQPAAITSRQSSAEAYRLGLKVWDRVREAKTFQEACRIFVDAGCKLHHYCRVD